MRSLGTMLLLIGAGTFALPFLGLQFKFMNLLGTPQNQQMAAIGCALVGVSLILFGGRRRS